MFQIHQYASLADPNVFPEVKENLEKMARSHFTQTYGKPPTEEKWTHNEAMEIDDQSDTPITIPEMWVLSLEVEIPCG